MTGHLAEFDPANLDRWEIYMEQVDCYLRVNMVTDNSRKRDMLLSVCGEATFKITKGLSAPAKITEKTFEEIVRLLTGHFLLQPSIIARLFLFHKRDQGAGETAAVYLAALRQIAGNLQL